MPSPTASSSQQEKPLQDSREQDAVPQTGMIDADGPNGSERDDPRPGSRAKDKDKDKEEVAFDFQKFLDQMKTKGAEPVAKYLRSYVPPS
jgi:Rab5 GDP/GTP exchange factor